MKTLYTTAEQERKTGMYTHLSSFLGYLFPFGNIIAPLIIWLSNRENAFIEKQGKAVLNFQISLYIYYILLLILGILFLVVNIGSLGFFMDEITEEEIYSLLFNSNFFYAILATILISCTLSLINIITTIIASIKASKGEQYNYPISIRFIR